MSGSLPLPFAFFFLYLSSHCSFIGAEETPSHGVFWWVDCRARSRGTVSYVCSGCGLGWSHFLGLFFDFLVGFFDSTFFCSGTTGKVFSFFAAFWFIFNGFVFSPDFFWFFGSIDFASFGAVFGASIFFKLSTFFGLAGALTVFVLCSFVVWARCGASSSRFSSFETGFVDFDTGLTFVSTCTFFAGVVEEFAVDLSLSTAGFFPCLVFVGDVSGAFGCFDFTTVGLSLLTCCRTGPSLSEAIVLLSDTSSASIDVSAAGMFLSWCPWLFARFGGKSREFGFALFVASTGAMTLASVFSNSFLGSFLYRLKTSFKLHFCRRRCTGFSSSSSSAAAGSILSVCSMIFVFGSLIVGASFSFTACTGLLSVGAVLVAAFRWNSARKPFLSDSTFLSSFMLLSSVTLLASFVLAASWVSFFVVSTWSILSLSGFLLVLL